MWIRDPLGEWHREGGQPAQPQSVVYTRRGQPRSVALVRGKHEREGATTVCGRTIDPRHPLYEWAASPNAGDPRCRACRDTAGDR